MEGVTQFDPKQHEEMAKREDAMLDSLPKLVRQAIAECDERANVRYVLDIWEAGGTVQDCIDFVNTGNRDILLRLI